MGELCSIWIISQKSCFSKKETLLKKKKKNLEDKKEKVRKSPQPDLRVVWEDGVIYVAAAALQGLRTFDGGIRFTGHMPGSP